MFAQVGRHKGAHRDQAQAIFLDVGEDPFDNDRSNDLDRQRFRHSCVRKEHLRAVQFILDLGRSPLHLHFELAGTLVIGHWDRVKIGHFGAAMSLKTEGLRRGKASAKIPRPDPACPAYDPQTFYRGL